MTFDLDEVFSEGNTVVANGKKYIVENIKEYDRPTELVLCGADKNSACTRNLIMRKNVYLVEQE